MQGTPFANREKTHTGFFDEKILFSPSQMVAAPWCQSKLENKKLDATLTTRHWAIGLNIANF